MRNLNEKDIQRLWDSGINCEQYELIGAMIAKAATIEAAQVKMIYSMDYKKPIEEQEWYKEVLQDFNFFCSAYGEECYEEMVEEFTKFIKKAQALFNGAGL